MSVSVLKTGALAGRLCIGAAVAITLLSACNRRSSTPQPCPRDSAAFRLQLTAPEGPLPEDVFLKVTFGGSSEESYSPRGDYSENKTVCCRSGSEVAGELPSVSCDSVTGSLELTFDAQAALSSWKGDSGSEALSGDRRAIQCELWTNGAARVEITAKGYQLLEDTLVAQPREDEEFEDCPSLVTKDVALVLERGDAGTPRP